MKSIIKISLILLIFSTFSLFGSFSNVSPNFQNFYQKFNDLSSNSEKNSNRFLNRYLFETLVTFYKKTQSEAFLDSIIKKLPDTFKETNKWDQLTPYQKYYSALDDHSRKNNLPGQFLKDCLKREQSYRFMPYVFAYHGAGSVVSMLTDFYGEIYRMNHSAPTDNFIFLRNPSKSIPLLKDFQRKGTYDHVPRTRRQQISASTNCVDEKPGESALHFYLCNNSAFGNELFKKQALAHGFRKSHADKLINLYSKHGEGFLSQIIIPEHIAEETVYCARKYGYIDKMFPTLTSFLETLKSSDKNTTKHKTQFRIVLASQYFANPESGIKFFKCPNAHYDQEKFNGKKEKIFQTMRQDWETDHKQF